MLRAVVDTNIFVSALIKPQGTSGSVLRYLRQAEFRLVYARPLLDELAGKLSSERIRDKYGIRASDMSDLLFVIVDNGDPVTITGNVTVCRDPYDNFVLESAINGRADHIVTGDKDLLILHPFQGINIMQATEFIRKIEEQKE